MSRNLEGIPSKYRPVKEAFKPLEKATSKEIVVFDATRHILNSFKENIVMPDGYFGQG